MAIICPSCKVQCFHVDKPSVDAGITHCGCIKNKKIRYWRFPALNQKKAIISAEASTSDLDATCLHHPEKMAQGACDNCGAFVCSLCLVEDAGSSFCLTCFSKGQSKQLKRIDKKGAQNVLYDDIALALALFPLLIFYFTIITAPISLYFVIRHWKKHPTSIVPRSRLRFILAGIFASGQIAGWIILITTLLLSI